MILLAAALVGLAIMFLPTVESAVHQWNTSSAYNYGYLIAPISAYLIWSERHALSVWRPSPSLWGVAVTAAFSFAWLLGDLMGIDEGRHIGLVGMMQGVFLAILGWPFYRRIAFALQYLWLQVPTGEFLLDPLQRLSHAVAVAMLKLSGIPVFGEGILIQVPSGNFLVEPGCAGLNFLLASLALSLLYGKLTYRRWPARLACVGVAVVGSILANFVRVYLIVAITEWTDRRVDITDDHLFYGWVFFGIIMMVMMWFGMRFRDAPDTAPLPQDEVMPRMQPRRFTALAAAAALCLAPAATALAVAELTSGTAQEVPAVVRLPDRVGDWVRVDRASDWSPSTVAGDAAGSASYIRGSEVVDLWVTFYAAQVDGREAAAAGNLPQRGDVWEVVRRSTLSLPGAGGGSVASLPSIELRSGLAARVAVYWYESSGCVTTSRLNAKLCAAADRLSGRPSPGAFVAASASQSSGVDAADSLADFISALGHGTPLIGRAVTAG